MRQNRFAALCAVVLACIPLKPPRALAQEPAHTRLTLDCALDSGPLDCGEIARSAAAVGLALDDDSDVMHDRLKIRALGTTREWIYSITASDSGGQRRVELHEAVSSATPEDECLVRLVQAVMRAVDALEAVATAESRDVPALAVRGNAVGDGVGRSGGGELPPIYARPSVNAELGRSGAETLALGSRVELSGSSPAWRVLTTGRASYRRLHLRIPGSASLDGSVWEASASATVVRSLGRGFSLASASEAYRSPGNNIRYSANSGVGIEWMHQPFRTEDPLNYGARALVAAVHQRYVTENRAQLDRQTFARPAARLFVGMHTGRLDLAGTLSASIQADRPSAWNTTGGLSANVRLTDNLAVDLSCEATLRGDSPNEPANIDALDPVAVVLAGNDFGSVAYFSELSLSYVLGNELAFSRDRRWR